MEVILPEKRKDGNLLYAAILNAHYPVFETAINKFILRKVWLGLFLLMLQRKRIQLINGQRLHQECHYLRK